MSDEDTGKHYRYSYKGINLDPARICRIYDVNCILQSAIIKKTLCSGNRGHKDILSDIDDIICAAKRWREIVIEDGKDIVVGDVLNETNSTSRIDHIMLRTNDIHESMAFYESIGMKVLDDDNRLKTEGYRAVFVGFGGKQDVKIELTYNPEIKWDIGNKQIADHIGIYVDNIYEVRKKFINSRQEYKTYSHKYGEKKYTFCDIISPEGTKIVLIQKEA